MIVITGGNNNEIGRQCQTFHSRSVGSGESWWQTSIMNAMNSQMQSCVISALPHFTGYRMCVSALSMLIQNITIWILSMALQLSYTPPQPTPLLAVAVETACRAGENYSITVRGGQFLAYSFSRQTNKTWPSREREGDSDTGRQRKCTVRSLTYYSSCYVR